MKSRLGIFRKHKELYSFWFDKDLEHHLIVLGQTCLELDFFFFVKHRKWRAFEINMQTKPNKDTAIKTGDWLETFLHSGPILNQFVVISFMLMFLLIFKIMATLYLYIFFANHVLRWCPVKCHNQLVYCCSACFKAHICQVGVCN